ncbi:hypothetical protein [Kaistia defluvii]|uniref:Minor tail protein n=1 Tax=Kaistia defluvii TaxID=410841 RepID=A0ABV2R4U7_9HYPH
MLPGFMGNMIAASQGPLFQTNFSEYATGSPPIDWSEKWDASAYSASVVAVTGSLSGKALRITKNGVAGTQPGYGWDRIPASADVEVLMRVRAIATWSAVAELVSVISRASGVPASKNAYRGVLSMQTSGSRWSGALVRYVSGAGTIIGAQTFLPTPNYTVNTWVYIRYRSVGNNIQVRIWPSGTAEPTTWLHSVTDTNIAGPGFVAIGTAFSTTPNSEIDYFAVDVTGRPIPIPL